MDLRRLLADLELDNPRPACSDAERRAAKRLARELRALGRRPRTDTLWIRPQWTAVWLVHALAGIAGSVVSVDAPEVALVLLTVVTLSALLELDGRLPGLSALWPRRATQNLVSGGPGRARVRLLVTAAYDSPRRAATFSRALRLGPLTAALALLAACAGARAAGVDAAWLGAVQLVPSVICIAAFGILIELAAARPDPAPRHGTAAAAALALVEELDRRPPRHLEVDLVLAGAGSAHAAGLRRFIRTRDIRPEQVAVLHLEPCGSGDPVTWRRTGVLRLHPHLLEAAEHAGFAPRDRGPFTGASAARRSRWPAVAVGRDGREGTADPAAVEDTVRRAAELVRALDRRVGAAPGRTS